MKNIKWRMETLKRKSWPDEIRDLAKSLNYRKHSVTLVNTSEKRLDCGYWDGGSRSSYVLWMADTGEVKSVSYPTAPPQFGGGDAPTVHFGDGSIPWWYVVSCGIFCGKQATLTIYGPDVVERFMEAS